MNKVLGAEFHPILCPCMGGHRIWLGWRAKFKFGIHWWSVFDLTPLLWMLIVLYQQFRTSNQVKQITCIYITVFFCIPGRTCRMRHCMAVKFVILRIRHEREGRHVHVIVLILAENSYKHKPSIEAQMHPAFRAIILKWLVFSKFSLLQVWDSFPLNVELLLGFSWVNCLNCGPEPTFKVLRQMNLAVFGSQKSRSGVD